MMTSYIIIDDEPFHFAIRVRLICYDGVINLIPGFAQVIGLDRLDLFVSYRTFTVSSVARWMNRDIESIEMFEGDE